MRALGTTLKAGIFLPWLVGFIPPGLEIFEVLRPLYAPVDDPYMIPLPLLAGPYLFYMPRFVIGY